MILNSASSASCNTEGVSNNSSLFSDVCLSLIMTAIEDDLWTRMFITERTMDEISINTLQLYVERFFHIRLRETTIQREIKCGLLHFISCAFVLAVNPALLEYAGYNPKTVGASTALTTGISCIISGLCSNLPFVLTPTTSTSLYYGLFLRNRALNLRDGNMGVFLLGFCLLFVGYRPIARLISVSVPFVLKVGVCLGVGLLISLEALTEIGLVKTGEHTVLTLGDFDVEIYIAMFSFVLIGLCLHFRIRGAFVIGLSIGTSLFCIFKGDRTAAWPPETIIVDSTDFAKAWDSIAFESGIVNPNIYRLVFDLFFVGCILISGITHGLVSKK